MDLGLAATLQAARTALQRNEPTRAIAVLDAAIASGGREAVLHALRGTAYARSGRHLLAIEDFDAALQRTPGVPALLFNRALALQACDRAAEALADFEHVARIDPGASEVHGNIGVLLLRMERHADAIPHFERARALAPDDTRVLRSLANALQGAGRGSEALPLHAECERRAPSDPAVLTDHGMALLRNGQASSAITRFQRALAAVPSDQTAFAGLYMASNELGDQSTVGALMDYAQLLGATRAPDADVDLGSLRNAVLGHRELRWEPAGRSTRHGQQSTMLDLAADSPFTAYGAMVDRFVSSRIEAVRGNPLLAAHPWGRLAPRRWRLQSWATVLYEGGHQSPHIHPAGWLSGVFYLDVGDARGPEDGALVFGHPPHGLALARPPREHVHQPATGELLGFPSYFFHHTRPYVGTRPRISMAFDVMPAD